MATQVRDTKAGQSVSAYIILNSKGEHVATVNAHFANSGRVSVDVWNHGAAVTRCASAYQKCDTTKPAHKAKIHAGYGPSWGDRAHDLFGLQQAHASGYGYDKRTAALSGLWIDGQQLADHCGTVANAEKARAALFAQYCKFHDYSGERARAVEKGWDRAHWDKRARKIGARFANWSSEKNRYTSLHFQPGLERLETLGYRVIQAI